MLSCESNLPLFQKTDRFDCPKGISNLVGKINDMIELDYISNENHELEFTNAGIEYMFRKHREFINNIKGKNIDFGPAAKLVAQLLARADKYGNCTEGSDPRKKFLRSNLYILPTLNEDRVNYNNIVFAEKNKDTIEPME